MSAAVPAFYLYGEPQRAVEVGFVHVESLDDRSRPSEWTIQPHVHRDLNHIILIAQGGGTMRADGNTLSFDAPCLLLVPRGIIHGFTWFRESRGWVMTISDSYLQHLLERDEDLQPLFRVPRAVPLPPAELSEVEADIQRLAQELAWSGPGQRGAIEALLLGLMVQALRHAALTEAGPRAGGRQARLVARLRERIELHFRRREPVDAYALALGVSETALRQACSHVAGMSPAAMVDERALLEARRLLLYSNLSIAEIAYAVGFDDPAYFSRFFARHLDRPPRDWRAEHGPAPGS
ncbi:helix-turn-helix domain-containing protein [Sphingobium chungbukense]|uniref:AraC family transcriptional regulator n=1 Tax=Sphingobium chungbukense TaxID=56193 RepID=A0A0M3ASW0_9SPHN|nr:helix-turn-helix domain-containing protein [Sphingobium chungbukense]KKW92031.1 AraC family transcriptional regulator [Sphingobium chungbukense]